jgi:arylsulfatase A-like enzyme
MTRSKRKPIEIKNVFFNRTCVIILFTGLFFLGLPCVKTSQKPSVILVTVDTLRADHLEQYGYQQPISPALTAITQRGALFKWAISPASCTVPAIVSIMTGLYPSFHSTGNLNRWFELSDESLTLADVFRENGYRTAAVIGNPVLDRSLNLNKGFDLYHDKMTVRELNRKVFERQASEMTDLALNCLNQFKDQPFFLWLHYQDPHGPYTPPETSLNSLDPLNYKKLYPGTLKLGIDHSGFKSIPQYQKLGAERHIGEYIRRYDAEISFLDTELGRLIDHLENKGYFKNNYFVFTSDHGEAMGEDDYFFAHSHSVGLDQIHVPLLITGPDITGKTVINVPVSTLDIFSTLLESIGIPQPDHVFSQSLWALMSRGNHRFHKPVYMESVNQIGIVWKDRMFRRDREEAQGADFWEKGNPNTGGEWYPLAQEFTSLNSSVTFSTSVKSDMERMLSSFEKRCRKTDITRVKRSSHESADETEMLKSLGYLAGNP